MNFTAGDVGHECRKVISATGQKLGDGWLLRKSVPSNDPRTVEISVTLTLSQGVALSSCNILRSNDFVINTGLPIATTSYQTKSPHSVVRAPHFLCSALEIVLGRTLA
jgi:hypothetical protein